MYARRATIFEMHLNFIFCSNFRGKIQCSTPFVCILKEYLCISVAMATTNGMCFLILSVRQAILCNIVFQKIYTCVGFRCKINTTESLKMALNFNFYVLILLKVLIGPWNLKGLDFGHVTCL